MSCLHVKHALLAHVVLSNMSTFKGKLVNVMEVKRWEMWGSWTQWPVHMCDLWPPNEAHLIYAGRWLWDEQCWGQLFSDSLCLGLQVLAESHVMLIQWWTYCLEALLGTADLVSGFTGVFSIIAVTQAIPYLSHLFLHPASFLNVCIAFVFPEWSEGAANCKQLLQVGRKWALRLQMQKFILGWWLWCCPVRSKPL